MNTIDFSILKPIRTITILLGTLACFAGSALADEPPSLESFTQREELVLTLSDEALATDDNQHTNQLSRHRNNATDQASSDKIKKRPVNLGCGMDVSQFGNDSNSLGNRLVGECNLDYRY